MIFEELKNIRSEINILKKKELVDVPVDLRNKVAAPKIVIHQNNDLKKRKNEVIDLCDDVKRKKVSENEVRKLYL